MLARPVLMDACAVDPGRSLPESGSIPDGLGSADDCGAGSWKPFPKYGGVLSGRDLWNAIVNEHEGPPYEYRARLRIIDDDMDTADGVYWPGLDVLNIFGNSGPNPGEILSGFGRGHDVPRGVRYNGHGTQEGIPEGQHRVFKAEIRRHGSRECDRPMVLHVDFD